MSAISTPSDLARHLGVPLDGALPERIVTAAAQPMKIKMAFSGLTEGTSYTISDRNSTGSAFVIDNFDGTVFLGAAFGTSVAYTTLPDEGSPLSGNLLPCKDVVTIEEFIINGKNQMSGAINWGAIVGRGQASKIALFSGIIPPAANFSIKVKNNNAAALTLAGCIVLDGHYVPVRPA